MNEGDLEKNGRSARAAVMEEAMAIGGELPSPQLRSLVCPYCGTVTEDTGRCGACSGRFDPLSRQATQNQMGPWFIRDDHQPNRPGCTYETLVRLIEQGKISTESVLRGPTTRQFWTLARHMPGVAHRLGVCHSCQASVQADGFACPHCHASFSVERDRQHLGLGPVRPLPGHGLPEVLALHAEPASQIGYSGGQSGGYSGVVSTPIDARGLASMDKQAGESPEMRQQVEEATKLARQWKSAWALERRRAWTLLVISGVITIVAMSYAILGGASAPKSQAGQGSTEKAVPVHE